MCGTLPTHALPDDALLLSFLEPGVEAGVEERWGNRFLSGRALIQEIRPAARAEYVELIARIGVIRLPDGRTLRQTFQADGSSRWWFLAPTEKDCVSDDDSIYTTILRLMAVDAARERSGVARVRVHGMDAAVSHALTEADGRGDLAAMDLTRAVARGVAARMALVAELVGVWWTLRGPAARPARQTDVLLQAYWDWTVGADDTGALRDRYFASVPAHLRRRGITVGWLAAFEPEAETWQQGRTRADVAAASGQHEDVVLLERFLAPIDIVREALNIGHALRLSRHMLDRCFRDACRVRTFDLAPLVRRLFLRSAWGSTSCRLQLMATAVARACRSLRPKVVLTFMEMLLRARPFYAGVRSASSETRVWAAQHAGYSSDKTLGVFDVETEINGRPDACPAPSPDGIFVMGHLSHRIWARAGLKNVVETGGLRYEKVRTAARSPRHATDIAVLLIGGMNEAAEIDLCDAIVTAAAGLPARILFRDHPSYRLSDRAGFSRFRDHVTVTGGTADEDLSAADLALFTHSGMAEEALLRGIPTWQWLWPGFNSSPFLDLPMIPAFTSVRALRAELEHFLREPARYQPPPDTQERVLRECFGDDPANASTRIADAVQNLVAVTASAQA